MISDERLPVLDHGYVEKVEYWGSDERIIESARMSTQKGFEGWGGYAVRCADCDGRGEIHSQVDWPKCEACKGAGEIKIVGDEKLLRYLWEHRHGTPFEMAGLTVEVQAPIFVIREWHRHRTQSYNEMSARYAPLPDLNYVPSSVRLLMGGNKSNKQAGTIKGAAELDDMGASFFQADLASFYARAQELYENALEMGVPKELARLCLPVGRYSRMRASANLRNWLGFLSLRMDPAAQWEIRKFAEAVHLILREIFPRTLALFDEGRK